ncbi:MAG TPA: SRPBCC family protein [Flavobacterium sp.]|jgi:hypothetical protein|nr:SRPBCC family protein [Flavobacterium sp.]
MRIIKYIFLLILLAMVALTVFVATQKGEFIVVKSRFIKSPTPTVFAYVNDYRNWENWSAWKEENPDMTFKYADVSAGKGASYSWKTSDEQGSSTTVFVKENDSISQKVVIDGVKSDMAWKFVDSAGGTKVTWSTTGRLRFADKISAAMRGGAENVIGNLYEKSLANLDQNLDYEINTFNIKLNGVVERPAVMFLKQTINSRISDFPKNSRILLSNLNHLFRNNNMKPAGKNFIIYHNYDTSTGITKFSVCTPVAEEIFISPGSDTEFGRLEPMKAVKTTLTGDLSHRTQAWNKAIEYTTAAKLERNPNIKVLEILVAGPDEAKRPSKRVTEIYIPLRAAAVRDTTRIVRPRPVARPVSTPIEEISIQ